MSGDPVGQRYWSAVPLVPVLNVRICGSGVTLVFSWQKIALTLSVAPEGTVTATAAPAAVEASLSSTSSVNSTIHSSFAAMEKDKSLSLVSVVLGVWSEVLRFAIMPKFATPEPHATDEGNESVGLPE